MNKNIGTADRTVRLVLAIIIFALFFVFESWIVRIIVLLVGAFVSYEAIAGWCALYALIGKNTCPIKSEK
jgi:predicted RND superfamily exporter protein